MKVLVINCGSTSLKYQLIDSDSEQVLAKGLCERIGIEGGMVKYTGSKTGTKYEKEFGELSVKVDNAVNKVEAYFAKIDSGKISVDKRSASFKAINQFKDMLLALQKKFNKV